jgi:hypothetical protein
LESVVPFLADATDLMWQWALMTITCDFLAHPQGECREVNKVASVLLFTLEGFNTANRTNFATVNNIVGAQLAPPFRLRGTARLSPSQPFGLHVGTAPA